MKRDKLNGIKAKEKLARFRDAIFFYKEIYTPDRSSDFVRNYVCQKLDMSKASYYEAMQKFKEELEDFRNIKISKFELKDYLKES